MLMSIKRRLKKLEKEAGVEEKDQITINMIPATGFPFKGEIEKCASYRRQAAEREESDEMIAIIHISCTDCKEGCEHAK
jgi:hypothetical protein